MLTKTALLLLLVVSVVAAGSPASASPAPAAADLTPVIIQFKREPALSAAGSDANAIAQTLREVGDDRTRLSSALGGVNVRHDYRLLFNGVAATMTPADMERARSLPNVAGVFPDRTVSASLNESVPIVGANQVWSQLGFTGTGIRIAVIDTGVDYTHPDLGSCLGAGCKVIGGYDFVNNDANPADDDGHGTHVAGIAAANGVVKGVAPGASILAYKVLGAGGFGSESWIMAALEEAIDPDGNPATNDGADVINLSLGGPGDPDDPMSLAVDNAVTAGAVVAVAAGNSGPFPQSIGSPGSSRKAITVGATDKLDALAFFSSLGPVVWEGGAIIKPDIVAPGVDICSSLAAGVGLTPDCVDTRHAAFSGTSMAAPHVAGAAALLVQAHPDWTPADVKAALRNTALDIGLDPNSQGYGRMRVLPAAQLPHAPPSASITTSGRLAAVTDILGTAGGVQFSRYALEIGAGMDPQSWSLLQQSITPVVDGVLKSGLDPFTLAEGFHTLRLVVESTDGLLSVDRVLIEVDNVSISSPLNNDILRKGGPVEITGTVRGGPGFQNYTAQWGVGHDPTQWFSTGITLTAGGTMPVVDGTLGQWNTAVVGAGSDFSLRLLVTSASGQTAEYSRSMYLDPTLKAGWPQRVPEDTFVCPFAPRDAQFYSPPTARTTASQARGSPSTTSTGGRGASPSAVCGYWSGFLEPVVSDLDADGDKEIVVYKGGEPPEVRAYREDGSLLWSVLIGATGVSGGNLHIPLIADIDNDNRNEVIVHAPEYVPPFANGKLFAIRHDGSIAPGWPVTVPLDDHPSLLAADLDVDGDTEVIMKANGGSPRQMTVVSGQGAIVSQWNLEQKSLFILGGPESTPAVGNMDADPELEIVTADPSASAGYDFFTGQWDNTGVIYVYNADGSVLPGWPVYTGGFMFGSPAVGDIDNNGQKDLVVGLVYSSDTYPDTRYGGLYAYGPAGNLLPGWPFARGYFFLSSPSLGDLDGNGDLEIAASEFGLTYVLHHNGAVATGWPQYTFDMDIYSTVIADVSGEGQPDILTTAGGGAFGGGVHAWHYSGLGVGGFPKLTEEFAEAPATVANIDADAQAELVASSDFDVDEEGFAFESKFRGSVYVWDLPGAYSGSAAHWSHFHHDVKHSGTYCQPVDALGGDSLNGCDDGEAPRGYYHPVTPARILDTRPGQPAPGPKGKVGPNGTITVDVTGVGGVPNSAEVSAVVVNVTVTEPTANSFLTVYPSGASVPNASNLNFVGGQTVPNLVTVKVGSDGNVKVYNKLGSVHVVFDVVGWYGGETGGSRFNPLPPQRVLDTRTAPQGVPAGAVDQGETVSVDVTGVGGVPASGVTAVVVNATVDAPTSNSFLTVYPSDAPVRPDASNLNFVAGQTVPNLVTVKVGTNGNVKVYNKLGSVHVIFDVVGWYGATGDLFHPLTPCRSLDSRPGQPAPGPKGKVAATTSIMVDVTGLCGVPTSMVSGVVVNTTVTEPTAFSFLTVYPSNVAQPPNASNLNFGQGQTVPNLVIARVGLDGNLKAYNRIGQVHVVMDAVGYFAP